jgi:hypothetical protein
MRERLSRSPRREPVSTPLQGGGGRPLRAEEREAVGATADTFRLENIRIHTGDRAAAAVHARGAEAMAQGTHVLLPHVAPTRSQGRALLRHEVAHALQHQAGLTATQSVDTLERQASAAETGAMPSFTAVSALAAAPPILYQKAKSAKKKKAPTPENLAVTHEGGVEGVDSDLVDDLALRISMAFESRMIQKGKRKKEVPSLLVLRADWKLAAELIQNPKALRGVASKRYQSLSSLFDVALADQLEALTDDQRLSVAAEVERRVVELRQDVPVEDLDNEFSQLHANLKDNLSGGFLGWVAMREGLLRAFHDLAGINDYYSKLVSADFPSGKVKGHGTVVHATMKSRLDRARGIIEKNGWMEIVEKSLGTRGLWATQVRENSANPVDVGTHAFGWAVDIEPSLNPDIRPFPALFKDVTGDDAGAGPSVVAMRDKNISLADAMTHSGKLRDMSDRLVAAFKDKDAILKAISAYLKREGASDLSDAERNSLGSLLEVAAGATDKKSQLAAIRSVETFVLALFDKARSAQAAAAPSDAKIQSTAMEDSLWVTEMSGTLGGLSSSPSELDLRWAAVEKQIDSPEAKAPANAKKLGLSPIYSKESVKTLKALTPVGRLQTKESLRRNLELRMHRAQATRTSSRTVDIFKLFLQAEKERPKDPVDRPTAAGVAAHGFQSLLPQLVGPLVAQEGAGLRWLGVMLGEKDTMHFELRPEDQPALPGGKYPQFLRGPGETGPKPAPDVVPEDDPAA